MSSSASLSTVSLQNSAQASVQSGSAQSARPSPSSSIWKGSQISGQGGQSGSSQSTSRSKSLSKASSQRSGHSASHSGSAQSTCPSPLLSTLSLQSSSPVGSF